MKTIRLLVTGRVQGVGYRFFVVDAARSLGLVGYARNLPSRNHVEVVAAGNDDLLRRLTDLLWTGPGGARVESMEATELAEAPAFDDFDIAF